MSARATVRPPNPESNIPIGRSTGGTLPSAATPSRSVDDVGGATLEIVERRDRLDRRRHDAREIGDDPLPIAVQDRAGHRPVTGTIRVHVLVHLGFALRVQLARGGEE